METPAGPLLLAVAAVGEVDPDYPLTSREAHHLEAYRNPLKRRQWLTSRALLQRVLDLPPSAEVLNLPGGKPFVTNLAQPISISHSHGYVAIAAAPGADPGTTVGVDIEATRQHRNGSVSRLFMNPQEQTFYQHCSTEIVFLAVWSAKEALYKAFYTHDGEITFKHHLAIAPSSLAMLPLELPKHPENHTLVVHTSLPGRPGRLEMGLWLDTPYVLTYLRV